MMRLNGAVCRAGAGRDAHGLNISVIGLWNEEPGPVPYILALRRRLDEGGLSHVRIIAPDGT